MKTEPDPNPRSQLPTPISQPAFTEKTALAFFARHLDELKWKYHSNEDRPSLFSGFNGNNALWDFNMTVRETTPGMFQLGVNSFIPNKALPPRRRAAMELLTRINFELALGCFEMNLVDGEIRFRTSVAIPGPDITPGLVEHLLRSNICIVDERYPQIMAVLYAGVTPEEALIPKEEKPAAATGPRFDFN